MLYSMSLSTRTNPFIRGLSVIACRDGTACLVNIKEARKVFTIPGHFAQIRLLATPTDSNILVVLYEDNFGRLCNLRNGKIENQNEIAIENEEEWEISYVKLRPTIPNDSLLYTDARYTINGSSTVFVNMYILLDQIERALGETQSATMPPNAPLAPDLPCIIMAKAILSTLYPFHIFESIDDDDNNLLAPTSNLDKNDMTKLVNLLFLRKFSSIKSVDGEDPMAALYSVPAKLGSRGISNTLTVFHAHQDLLQISGEITSMVYLVSVVLARVLLETQMLSASASSEENEENDKRIEAYFSRFVDVLFTVSENHEGQQYKRPWLRGFARFWSSDRDAIRRASRTCLSARLNQLNARPKELSLTISRWRVLLPGVIVPKRRNSNFRTLRRLSGASGIDDRRLSLERITTADAPDLEGNDEVIDDSPEFRSALSGIKDSDDDCIDAISESSIFAVIILGNLAIDFAARVSHVVQREIVSAIEFFLFRSDTASNNPAEDSAATKGLQNIAIELVGKGWKVWGDDEYFSTTAVISRLIDLHGADSVPMVAPKNSTSISDAKVKTKAAEDTTTGLSHVESLRHELLLQTTVTLAFESINRVIEVSSDIIAKSPNVQSRIGAVRMIYHIAKVHPDLLVNRLFPIVDATIASLDPSSNGVRNKIVNSVTALFNLFVNTFPVIASHRAQQRLALALQPDIVIVYDLRTSVQMASLEGAKHQVFEIQFSPEGRHVVGIDRVTYEVYVWKLGHSFLSMIQSIGGGGPAAFGTGHYSAYYNGAVSDAAGMDLVFPRYVGKLKSTDFRISDKKVSFEFHVLLIAAC